MIKQILFDNHSANTRNGKSTRQLPLEYVFVFCKTFKRITEGLGCLIIFRTADLQDNIYKNLANMIAVTINSLYLFVPIFSQNPKTQVKVIDSVEESFTLSFESWTTGRKNVQTGNEF